MGPNYSTITALLVLTYSLKGFVGVEGSSDGGGGDCRKWWEGFGGGYRLTAWQFMMGDHLFLCNNFY